jgi:uncharacterized protein YdiU (UPF0061 family)
MDLKLVIDTRSVINRARTGAQAWTAARVTFTIKRQPEERGGPRGSLGSMTAASHTHPAFEDTFAIELWELVIPWDAAPAPAPQLLALNRALASDLGFDPEWLATRDGMALLLGHTVPEGATPVAQAYAGHQFGGYSPRLGDGRALLIGEVVDEHGCRHDLHLKGSGRTPFSRGGDGKAAVGPMLREYVISEAMHALGIPTTRALAVVATGEQVVRETMLPGAVLTRVAASHLRVGTFQYAAANGGPDLVRKVADYAISRHHPQAAESGNPYLALFSEVVDAQASLIARWMLAGFIHGVMNTDNKTISGESIDYGPCAFMDTFDPATVFSSIDHGGRYAYGNQPAVAQWNLARLAEALLPLIGPDSDQAVESATEMLNGFSVRYAEAFKDGMRAKLGLSEERPGDDALISDLLTLLEEQRVDFTSFFRALAEPDRDARGWFSDTAAFEAWEARRQARLAEEGWDPRAVTEAMDRVNPVYIPRNHLVEDALASATAGDLGPFDRLVEAVSRPFEERPGLEVYASPPPDGFGDEYRTFCGT